MEYSVNTHSFIKKISSKLNIPISEATDIIVKGKYSSPAKLVDGEITEFSHRTFLRNLQKSITQGAKIDSKFPVRDIDFSDLGSVEYLALHGDFNKDSNDSAPEKSSLCLNENRRLKHLEFALQNIDCVNIKNCKDLEFLSCQSNILEILDLSDNKQLKQLDCRANNLNKLDLSNNNFIVSLYAENNPMDDGGLVLPTPNQLMNLHLSHNNISELDFNELGDLVQLGLANMPIKRLDLVNLKKLSSLSLKGLELDFVDISRCNKFSSFEVQNCKIKHLRCNELQCASIPSLSKTARFSTTKEKRQLMKIQNLHKKAVNHNWDEGLEPLKRVLTNKSCDLATALSVYWMGGPYFFAQYNSVSEARSHEKENFRFMSKLEKDILNGKFSQSVLPFNPIDIDGTDFTQNNYPELENKRDIPELFFQRIVREDSNAFDANKIIDVISD